jgi:hypothetical protein
MHGPSFSQVVLMFVMSREVLVTVARGSVVMLVIDQPWLFAIPANFKPVFDDEIFVMFGAVMYAC